MSHGQQPPGAGGPYQPGPGAPYGPGPGEYQQPGPAAQYQPGPGAQYQPGPGAPYHPGPGAPYNQGPEAPYNQGPGVQYQQGPGASYQYQQGLRAGLPPGYLVGLALLGAVVLYDLIVVVSVRWSSVFSFSGDVDDLSNVFPLTMTPIMLLTMVALALLARRVKSGQVLGVVTAFLHVVGYTVNIVLTEAMPDTTRGLVHDLTRHAPGEVLVPAVQVLLALAAAVVLLLPATAQVFRRA